MHGGERWEDLLDITEVMLTPAACYHVADVLVDGMRGPSSIWYRIRINLQHVPVDQRPPQEELIADYSPWNKEAQGPEIPRG